MSMTKTAGSGARSRAFCQRHGSADLDTYQYVTDQKVPDPSESTRLLGIIFHVMGTTCLLPEKDGLFPGGEPVPELLRLSVKTAEIPLAVAPGGLPVLTGGD
jgi:hypothetical protein